MENVRTELQTTDTISHGQPSKPIKLNTIADYVYALLAIILYIASIAIVAMFVWNVHQVNDLSVLRENLRNDLVAGDIRHIVQMVLSDVGLMEHTPLDDISNKPPDDGSTLKIKIAEGNHQQRSKRSARQKRNSRSNPWITSSGKRRKRRNGRPLRLW